MVVRERRGRARGGRGEGEGRESKKNKFEIRSKKAPTLLFLVKVNGGGRLFIRCNGCELRLTGILTQESMSFARCLSVDES